MKVSLILTVKNEEKSIRELLESIMDQTKKPDEIIIVDGGSTDKTVDVIKSVRSKKIKIIQKKGNIAEGRNAAIRNTKNDIVFVTDAGCVLDKNWIRETIKFFPEADVVAGNYKPIARNTFEYFQGLVTIKKVDRPSRMSSRNIVFKKKCWEIVGGYPTKSLTGEDTNFNITLVQHKFKIKINPRAGVSWRMRPTIRLFTKQFFKYGQGDRIQGNLRELKANLLMVVGFWVYLALFILGFFIYKPSLIFLIALPVIYLSLLSIRFFVKTAKISSFVYIPLLELTKRISYIMGASFG